MVSAATEITHSSTLLMELHLSAMLAQVYWPRMDISGPTP